MDINMKQLQIIKDEQMKKNFERNNIECLYFDNSSSLITYFKDLFVNQKTVAVGGSATINELGLLELIQKSDVHFFDRYQKDLSPKDLKQIFRESFFADMFITSTNALTIDGCLYNIDGTGNRVSAMIYGPEDVYVIAGRNKIFDTEDQAIHHIRSVSAPANALRLNRKTPCTIKGTCQDCLSDDRICSSYVKLSYQKIRYRIHLLILEGQYGY